MAPEAKKKVAPSKNNPMTGLTVLWYPRADVNEEPRPAIVVGPHPASERNMLDLAIFKPGTGQYEHVKHVRPVGDPHFKAHPKVAANNGGWAPRRDVELEEIVRDMVVRLVPALVSENLDKRIAPTKETK